ncbi:UNKNOWN [Stylonychia lemnae]|uniref:Uncharacterized protein n=1 Tax=Stylonychia lemnae TaxID=5949 RepID=A0A078AX95_STYLE|nr:UNKNOWN [Stylonychia lemnae]|eukprot:CDW87080.1 UNKNOWN [Stylonychia lemnae]
MEKTQSKFNERYIQIDELTGWDSQGDEENNLLAMKILKDKPLIKKKKKTKPQRLNNYDKFPLSLEKKQVQGWKAHPKKQGSQDSLGDTSKIKRLTPNSILISKLTYESYKQKLDYVATSKDSASCEL